MSWYRRAIIDPRDDAAFGQPLTPEEIKELRRQAGPGISEMLHGLRDHDLKDDKLWLNIGNALKQIIPNLSDGNLKKKLNDIMNTAFVGYHHDTADIALFQKLLGAKA